MSLKLTNQPATLKNLNVRKERHGEDKVLAIDLKIDMQTSVAVLDRFDPGLQNFMFNQEVVRFPTMGAITFEDEIDHVAIDISGAKINDATLKKFHLLPALDAAGNKIVDMTFTCSYYPQTDDLNKLSALVQDSITLTIDTQELV